ncbi:MAG: DUF892 family protein [Chitinophagaceae bacterium]|nr:DUF892 family protein [Chitinophagaceae bacterium]
MNQLKDLLKHEIMDLQSAEDQIIEALPLMIGKAKNAQLKKSLEDHLRVTVMQRERLDEVMLLLEDGSEKANQNGQKSTGFLSGLFKGAGKPVCKGMQGLITEGQKIMKEDMDADVMDAAIIGAAQKIEHYEICGYGTLRAFAEQLSLTEVEKLLRQTLDEEYQADDLLTELAVGKLNKEAMNVRRSGGSKTSNSNSSKKSDNSTKKSAPKKKAAVKTTTPAKKKAAKKSKAR